MLFAAAETLVEDLEKIPKTSEDQHFKIRIDSHDEHSLGELWTDLFIPVFIEVRILVVEREQG